MKRYDCDTPLPIGGTLESFGLEYLNLPGHPIPDSVACFYPQYKIVVVEGTSSYYFYDSETKKRISISTLPAALFRWLVLDFTEMLVAREE